MRCRRPVEAGFTLIELMIVVAILGILAAVAIPAFLEYMRKGKGTEVHVQLNRINKAAKLYFVQHAHYPSQPADEVPAALVAQFYCGTASSAINEWYDPAAPCSNAWCELEIAVPANEGLRFAYQYDAINPITFLVTARGDLDCDANLYTFDLEGAADSNGPNLRIVQTSAGD